MSRQGLFPGIVQLPDGELLGLLSIGQAFDAADMRSYVIRSRDEGLTWTAPVRLHGTEFDPPEQESFKPVLLQDGTMLATGDAFVRPDPLQPIVDPVTLALPELRTKISVSTDLGHNWSVPRRIDIQGAPLELSGPATQLPSGRMIAATSPFHLRPDGHAGWIVASDDGGQSWFKLSEFFRAGQRHSRLGVSSRQLGRGQGGRALVGHDHTTERNLNNRISLSSDGARASGRRSTPAFSASHRASFDLDGERLLTIHAQRENDARLVVRLVDLSEDMFRIEDELDLC